MNLAFHPGTSTPSYAHNAFHAKRVVRGMRGLGDSFGSGQTVGQTSSEITGAGAGIANAISTSSTASEIGSAIASGADIAALFLGPAGPIVAAIGNALGGIISQFHGCGQTCIQATNIANSIGTPMATAFQAYMSAPIHYYSAQQSFLAYFQQLMTALNNACGNPQLGSAGRNCISDNSPNACQWKAAPGGWNADPSSPTGYTYTYWGAAGSGDSCWNPWTGIYNEVLNDPTVVPDPVAGTSTTSGNTTGSGSSLLSSFAGTVTVGSLQIPTIALVGGALLLLAVML